MSRKNVVDSKDIEAGLGLLDAEKENANAVPIDRSVAYRRLKGLGVWPLAERLIDKERKRLRSLGKTRAEAGESAWQLADREFITEAALAGKELHKALPKTPDGLTGEQAIAWRLAVAILITTTCRSTKLIRVAQRLTSQAHLRSEMGDVGDYDIPREEIDKSLSLLRSSSQNCVGEVDRITALLSEIDADSLSDELADEASDLLEGLCDARQVLKDAWATTPFALPSA